MPLRTTISNYTSHRRNIPFDDLPRSFRDAVIITVHIGAKRLWIDSLCIIQDSVHDWQRECAKMADVYANAMVGIAACDARDASHGFLHKYPSKLRLDLGGSVSMRCIPFELLDPPLNNESSLLSKRGWALQGSILSQRCISFKANRMEWQCLRNQISDDIRFPYAPSLVNVFGRKHSHLAEGHSPDETLCFDNWYDIVELYNQTKLTKTTDKLPALSGLAKIFSR